MLPWLPLQPFPGVNLRIVAGSAGIRAIDLNPEATEPEGRDDGHLLLREAARQLCAFFEGRLRIFDLPLDMQGTAFQRRVWDALTRIPYAATRSYGDIAREIGSPSAVRAVGAANGSNPVPIVVPCHRVIGSSGKLVGYGGGLRMKKLLLELEAKNGFTLE